MVTLVKIPEQSFFPSSACTYAKDDISLFSGLSIYFLLDAAKGRYVPYATIAFYPPNMTEMKKSDLIEHITKRLADSGLGKFQVLAEKKKDIVYLGINEVSDHDDEGDPRNVCQRNKEGKLANDWLAAVKTRKKGNVPEYSLLVHVEFLCRFGDMLFSR